MDDITNTLQMAFDRLSKISNESENLKKELIDKLKPKILELDINFEDKPRNNEVKIAAVNTYVNLIDSYEKSVRDTVKVTQKEKENKDNKANAENTTAILKAINLVDKNVPLVENNDNSIIDTKAKEQNIVITEGELEKSSDVSDFTEE
jgi:hypothetical protein